MAAGNAALEFARVNTPTSPPPHPQIAGEFRGMLALPVSEGSPSSLSWLCLKSPKAKNYLLPSQLFFLSFHVVLNILSLQNLNESQRGWGELFPIAPIIITQLYFDSGLDVFSFSLRLR